MGKLLWLFLFAFASAAAVDVAIEWDVPNDLSGIDGYEIHYGPAPGAYDSVHDVPGATSGTTTVPGLPDDQPTYFAARSRSIDGFLVSGFSNEVVYSPLAEFPPDVTGANLVYAVDQDPNVMAISYLSLDQIESTSNASSASITVDSSADAIIVFVVGHEDFNTGTSFFDGLNFDDGGTNDFTHLGTCRYGIHVTGGAYIMTANSGDWPGTGSQTIYWDGVGTAAWNAGMTLVVSYWSGVDQNDPVRDTELHDLAGLAATEESSLSGVQSTDMSVGVAWSYQQTPDADPATYGQTAVLEDIYNNFGIAIQYEEGEDVMRFEGLAAGDGGIVWAAIKAEPITPSALIERNIDKYRHILVR